MNNVFPGGPQQPHLILLAMLTIGALMVSGCQLPGARPTDSASKRPLLDWQAASDALFRRPIQARGDYPDDRTQQPVNRDANAVRVTNYQTEDQAMLQEQAASRQLYVEQGDASAMQIPHGETVNPRIPQREEPGSRFYADQLTHSPPQSAGRSDIAYQQNQLRDERPARFYADELTHSLPQSATERVIELTSEMAIMRQEIQRLSQSVQRLQQENGNLMSMRNQLSTRLANLESRLEKSMKSEEAANSRFELLSQRVQVFNERRQKQIAELNLIIDQLERQLRQPRSTEPTTQPTTQSTIQQTTNSNPYRNPAGVYDARR